ncbi:MAG: hypothetical protein V3S72_05365, partial [Desulfobacterales bacterium]
MVVQRGAHHLIDHVEGRKGRGVDGQQPVSLRFQTDFAFPGFVFPAHALSAQRIGHNGCCFVFMNLV